MNAASNLPKPPPTLRLSIAWGGFTKIVWVQQQLSTNLPLQKFTNSLMRMMQDFSFNGLELLDRDFNPSTSTLELLIKL